jgi:hypothetical protein
VQAVRAMRAAEQKLWEQSQRMGRPQLSFPLILPVAEVVVLQIILMMDQTKAELEHQVVVLLDH